MPRIKLGTTFRSVLFLLVFCLVCPAFAAEYEKKLEPNYSKVLYEALLQPDGEPKKEILGFQLTSLECSDDGGVAEYQKNKKQVTIQIVDAQLLGQKQPDVPGLMSSNFNLAEAVLREYEWAQAEAPERAIEMKKSGELPVKHALPTGEPFYIWRKVREKNCGYISGSGFQGRFFVSFLIEEHDATQSEEAAISTMNQAFQCINWEKLK